MKIPKEIDNDECRAALLEVGEEEPSLYRTRHPIDVGALVWHGFVEVRDAKLRITPAGVKLLQLWHPKAQPKTAPQTT